jgi:methylamine--corrinoid protein Co-methyltransferase
MTFSTSRIIEITRAAQTGPFVEEKEFDLKVIPSKLKQLAKDYDITYNRERPVPNDPQLADHVFEAARDFLRDVGILCIDTRRVIKFDEGEIKEAANSAPTSVRVGTGNDSREINQRKVEDPTRPTIVGGLGGGIVSEQYYEDIMTSIAVEPVIDAVCGGSLVEIEGGPIIRDSPIEMHAAKFEALCMRNAVARAGRPGLCVLAGSPEGAAAVISAFDPKFGYRRTDMAISCLVYPMKTTLNLLNKAKYFVDYRCPIFSYADHLIGGYTGGPDMTAISMTAHHLANQLINKSSVQEVSCQDIRYNNTSSRMSIWAHSVVAQALARNTRIITFSEAFASSGPCTEMLLYEAVAPALAVVSGAHAGPGPAGCGTKEVDRFTGLEERFFGEVAVSLAGEKLEYANDIAKAILPKYEHMFPNPPLGKRFDECYDVGKMTPTAEWLSVWQTVRKEMTQIGLKLGA